MLNTAAWPELELSVLTGIQLDPKNVRLETTNAQVEADILEDLFANEDALGLVDAISKVGYLTHETPIVVKRRGKYVVVEGNRRIAALKAIQNPMLVPKYQSRVSAYAKAIPNVKALAKIRVMVAPNQAAAEELIAAIHTGNLRRAWSPARQAAFFQAQIDGGRKYADLLRRYPTIDVKAFVFRSHIVNLFRKTDYDDPAIKDFMNTKEWKKGLSTLSRIYESKQFLDLTGLVMDDKGVLHRALTDDQMKAVATNVVEGIKVGDLNTRSINTIRSPRFTRLMAELKDLVGAPSPTPPPAGPTPTPRKKTAGGPGPTPPAKRQPTPKPPAKAKAHFLPVGHLAVPTQYPSAVRLHLEELSYLDIQKYPNTTFLALRALLEKSIKSYADAKNIDIKASNNTQGYVQLRHALTWFGTYLIANGPKPLIQPVNQLRNGKLVNYTASNDALNAINHNHHFCVDPDEVLNCWNSMDSIMRELMKP